VKSVGAPPTNTYIGNEPNDLSVMHMLLGTLVERQAGRQECSGRVSARQPDTQIRKAL
jgi:hypothetical protein